MIPVKKSLKRRLTELGFTYVQKGMKLKIGCRFCEAIVINGTPCHELTCPALYKVLREHFTQGELDG